MNWISLVFLSKTTRMHSSRMRTARPLTVRRNVVGWRAWWRGRAWHARPHPVNRMTDRHVQKHNLRKLRLRVLITFQCNHLVPK